MAVRQHLSGFNQKGLVAFANRRRPVGRPVREWRLTERAAERFPDSHAELTLEMITAVRTAFGEEDWTGCSPSARGCNCVNTGTE